MGERLGVANAAIPTADKHRQNIIGRRVRTDPSGRCALGEEEGIPFGAQCRLAEIGPNGTYGFVVSLPSEEAIKTKG